MFPRQVYFIFRPRFHIEFLQNVRISGTFHITRQDSLNPGTVLDFG